MIDSETVFIIGAGANIPFGYPTGSKLRQTIIEKLQYLCKRISKDERSRDHLLGQASELSKAFKASSTQSIDLFLSRNPPLEDIGKKAIILSILWYEEQSKFREEVLEPNQDWYSYLFHRMTSDIDIPNGWKEFKNNKVSFITFNYDRSLEHFFHESLTHSFSAANETEISKQIQSIPIHHVYGKTCLLPWESNGDQIKIPYLSTNKEALNLAFANKTINRLKANIKIINERSEVAIQPLIQCIKKAKNLFLLGFGFATENIEILKLNSILNQDQNIYGTAMGFLDNEKSKVRETLMNNFKVKDPRLNNPRIEQTDCLTLLRKYL
ncbi:hypothetical protein KJ966_10020 [bacterium]|nr:hypothetical protein [bacterium]